MNTINSLGIRIVGIILLIMLVGLGAWKGASFVISRSVQKATTPTPTPTSSPAPATIIGPNSTVPPQIQEQISAYVSSAEQSIGTQTNKYIASLPQDATREQVLDQKTLDAFIDKNKGPLLPELPEGTVLTTTASGKNAIQKYLDSISPVQNTALKIVTGDMITEALQKQISGDDIQALAPVRASIEKNYEIFKSVQAPAEAKDLHTKLLQATASMISNISLLQAMQQDFVAALIGHKNITQLDSVFDDISKSILALETKYGIK